MVRHRLMTPGPTPIPESARLEMAKTLEHHRTPGFRQLLGEVLEGLKYVFDTTNDIAVLTSSGTGAMETCVANVVPRGGKAIVLDSGKFAQRWGDICEAYGITVVRHKVPWGKSFEADKVAHLLAAHPDAAAVYATLSETSTGVGHDIESIGRAVAASDALFAVDGISGVGAIECHTDAWNIDLLAVGSQKALMSPPGLAFVAVSESAWRRIESIDRQAFYFDLAAYRKALAGPDTPYTPSRPLLSALAANLSQIRAETIETVWRRTATLARATRAGVEALGLRLVAERPSEALTAAFLPEGVEAKAFLARLESRFGVKLAGGQGPLSGKIIRIAHMGQIDELDILSTLSAIEMVLAEMGQSVKLGVGVAAAGNVLLKEV
ncbi:MAG: alanine--glyoxylate aminotransferase family protein [Planctomycetota bacterium]|nr:alanine--glyoxylate aminotransferase family protein [Planctomycetota bacterium]